MGIKFSEDVVPLTDLKVNPGRVVRHAAEAHRPVLLTSRGRGVAVVQSVTELRGSRGREGVHAGRGRWACRSGGRPRMVPCKREGAPRTRVEKCFSCPGTGRELREG